MLLKSPELFRLFSDSMNIKFVEKQLASAASINSSQLANEMYMVHPV